MILITLYFLTIFIILIFIISVAVYLTGLIYSSLKGSPYVPTKRKIIQNILKQAGLKKGQSFIDIGCGDGRVVLVASLFTDAAGIEFDQELVDAGNTIKTKLKLTAKIVQGDFFAHDFSQYDIIFTNPDTGFYNGIEDKLLKELRGTLIVYNQVFLPRFLKRGKTHWINGIPMTEYTNRK